MTKELINIDKINMAKIFTVDGMEPIIEEIKNKVAEFEPDLSTATSRKEIASMAAKVSRCKTILDGVGKSLVADIKSKAKVVDDARKSMRDQLDVLRDDTRAPLNKWEEEDADRVDDIKSRIQAIKNLITTSIERDSKSLTRVIDLVETIDIGDQFCEFQKEAQEIKDRGLINLGIKLKMAVQNEEQQAKILKLEREAFKREAKAKADAKELAEAKRETAAAEEAKVKAVQQKSAAEARAAKALKAKKEAEVQAKADALETASNAEAKAKTDKLLAEEKAKVDKAQAEADALAKYEREAQAALDAEVAEKERKAADKQKRKKDEKHKKDIFDGAAIALMNTCNINHDVVSHIMHAIDDGKIPHVTINY